MENESEAESAIENINGTDVLGRNLKVNRANPRKNG